MANNKIKSWTLNLPQVTLVGDVSCRVENYTRIVQFASTHIAIEAVGGTVHIDGQELILSSFTEECINITGKIGQVRYET